MWKSFYEGHELLQLPLLAMAGFMVAFVVAVVRAWRKNGPHDPRAAMPLDDEQNLNAARSDA